MLKLNSEDVEVIDIHVHPPNALTYGHRYPQSFSEELVGELLSRMDEARVDKVCLLAIDVDPQGFERFLGELDPSTRSMARLMLSMVGTLNEEVKEYVDRFPERIVGFGSVNPHAGEDYVSQAVGKIKDYGFKGVKLLPTVQFFNPEDEVMDTLYRRVYEEGLVLMVHTGCDPGPWEKPWFSSNANPIRLAKVASRYPNLRIVAAHMGSYSALHPGIWFNEMMKVAKAHSNVYVDIAAVFSRRLIKRAIEELGVERVLFGSDYPAISGFCDRGRGMANCVKWVAALNLDVGCKRKLLGENAKRLLRL